MTSSAGARRGPARYGPLDLTSLVLAALFGEYSLLIMPFILAAMMDVDHLSEVLAGRLVSLQLLAMAIAAVAVSARMRAGRSVRSLLVAGIAAISLANILCTFTVPVPILAAARALTGLGEGAVMAAAAAAVCATSDPHRVFSLIGGAVAFVASLALLAVPWLTTLAGPGSIFWLLGLVPLTLLPFLGHIPLLSQASEAALGLPPPAVRMSAATLLVSFLLLWTGASGLWVYAERIGAFQGLTREQVGVCLAIGQLAGIPGPFLAAWGGPRLGTSRSLVAGCVGMAAATLLFVLGGNRWLFALGGSLASFSIMFVVPCFRSRMAALDVSGRTVAASAGFYTVGFGIAPLLVASITTEAQGYAPVAILCCACFLGSAALAFSARPKLLSSGNPTSVPSRIAE